MNVMIHGHFYQPPREGLFSTELEKDEGASPFHDFNEKICSQCYAPLADGGKKSLLSNLSFNFGPTLLDWMTRCAPRVAQNVKDAALFQKDQGALGAMAQPYNHSILPLDTKERALIEIHWGIEHFRNFYKTDPEGMWLSETAISPSVVDSLAEMGIRYVILRPTQIAVAKGPSRNAKLAELQNSVVWVEGKKEKILAILYDEALSGYVSFGHALRDAQELSRQILSRPRGLTVIATDGEIYGHHESVGAQGLAQLFKDLKGSDAKLINGAALLHNEDLSSLPTEHLWRGKDGKGSSWSCSCGVLRWERSCPCQTGGDKSSDLKWRAPLRKACSLTWKGIKTQQKEELRRAEAPESAQRLFFDYILVILGKKSLAQLLEESGAHNFSKERVLDILEARRLSLLSFTSCAWFFYDLSGREPRHALLMLAGALAQSQKLSPRRAKRISKRVKIILSRAFSQETGESGAKLFEKAQQAAQAGAELQ